MPDLCRQVISVRSIDGYQYSEELSETIRANVDQIYTDRPSESLKVKRKTLATVRQLWDYLVERTGRSPDRICVTKMPIRVYAVYEREGHSPFYVDEEAWSLPTVPCVIS
jgi:hypothetical protein